MERIDEVEPRRIIVIGPGNGTDLSAYQLIYIAQALEMDIAEVAIAAQEAAHAANAFHAAISQDEFGESVADELIRQLREVKLMTHKYQLSYNPHFYTPRRSSRKPFKSKQKSFGKGGYC